jgi:tetratricopeptide (TPR) repeat protein
MPSPVDVRREVVELPTYAPQRPDPNPMFLEKRVYQGSSGRVYPLPCTDRIASTPRPQAWNAVFLENEYLLVMLLPELGGRIHRILDKTNGYDAVYYQPVIKPALVGLAGPWCSGGIELNWPQHHRPSTFLPTEVAVETHADGSATVWMSEHDPMARMKGMHGVRLQPGKSLVELRVRAYNRTTDTQTFLWWANAATCVHAGYQSFFPPDVTHVADHAKRAMTSFPRAGGRYYGVDYAARAGGLKPQERPTRHVPPHAGGPVSPGIPTYRPDDLSWYANIPVPTSYMCMGSTGDFAGGYDHTARAGLIHVANHHISPGKKQWTWGNHEFGYAWDRNLTDADANGEFRPYIELMTGVYTDNQPDFSFLQPGETKTWSQFWYPFRDIGPAVHATVDAALSVTTAGGALTLGIAVTAVHPRARIQLLRHGVVHAGWTRDLAPASPATVTHRPKRGGRNLSEGLAVRVTTPSGAVLLDYAARPASAPAPVPEPAIAPAPAAEVASSDELYHIGLHLDQYRHATRLPEVYWREALRRDPGDARSHLALGRWHLRRGEFSTAEQHLRQSLARILSRNPNPYDGEPHYQLGRCLQYQFFADASRGAAPLSAPGLVARLEEAYAAFYKATWNSAWQAAGFHALGEIDVFRGDWVAAEEHLQRALRVNADNLRARNLLVVVLRQRGLTEKADALLNETLSLDPLDGWALALAGKPLACDNQVRLDLALDHARAGLFGEALILLADAVIPDPDRPDGSLGTWPLIHYTRAWLTHLQGLHQRDAAAPGRVRRHLRAARAAAPDYCFPARLEEITILEFALRIHPKDARASFYLGNLLYDRRRHDEAIAHWEHTVRHAPQDAMAWRNLGIAYHNIRRQPERAVAAYEHAVAAAPASARYLYERDQLWKRLRHSPAKRLRALRAVPHLVSERDDLAIEYCALCNQSGDPRAALDVLSSRRFQPWEGGEGQVLSQYVRTRVALGRAALAAGKNAEALDHFRGAMTPPENLGEARHPLANASDLHYWLGCALAASGEAAAARRQWTLAASFQGDFQEMRVRSCSEQTYFSILALRKLGREREARKRLAGLLQHARALAKTPATIDYFATSLPTLLLFDDDLQARQATTARLLEGQALLGLGRRAAGRLRLRQVLKRDPSHALAADLLSS